MLKYNKSFISTIKTVTLLMLVSLTSNAFAESHKYINRNRSSINSHLYIQQSIEGEVSKFSEKNNADKTSSWSGFGIGTEAGLEVMKFIQFKVGHTYTSIDAKDTNELESISGSKLNAGVNLVFAAPVFNLELGAGVIGSRVKYQKNLEVANLNGSGLYQSIGFNRYLSSKISVFANVKLESATLTRTSGSTQLQDFKTKSTLIGAGFRIWL